MWTRRVLLATLVAACAMSLPRQMTPSWNITIGSPHVASQALR